MNITLGGGKAVHLGYQVPGCKAMPECGGNRAGERYTETSAEVTCKKCLKVVAKLAATEVAAEAPVEAEAAAEATQTCGTCGEVTKVECTDGFTEIYVTKCMACIADEAKADDVLFDAMLDLEQSIRAEDAGSVYGVGGKGYRDLCIKRRGNLKAELYGMWDQLTPAQIKAYSEYRSAQTG